MKQVLFKEGQMVRAGQLLATIDSRPFEMAVMQSEGQRLRDQAQLDNARLTLERFQTLLKQDSIPGKMWTRRRRWSSSSRARSSPTRRRKARRG